MLLGKVGAPPLSISVEQEDVATGNYVCMPQLRQFHVYDAIFVLIVAASMARMVSNAIEGIARRQAVKTLDGMRKESGTRG